MADLIGERNLCAAVIGAAFKDLALWQNRLKVIEENGTDPDGFRRRVQRAADGFLDMESDLHFFASDNFQWMCAFTGMDGDGVANTAAVYSTRAVPLMLAIKEAIARVGGGDVIAERRDSQPAKAQRMNRWRAEAE